MFRGFSKGFFKRSIAVNLTDERTETDKEKDTEINHAIVTGSIMQQGVFRKIGQDLKGQKADLIFERMLGGAKYLPQDLWALKGVLQRSYELLAEGGVMFIQLPSKIADVEGWGKKVIKGSGAQDNLESETLIEPDFYGKVLDKWLQSIEEKYKGVLEVKRDRFALRLNKLKNAPEKFPLIDLTSIE